MTVLEWLPWIERLGGWGVVALIVIVQSKRAAAQTEALIDSNTTLKAAVMAFTAFESEERRVHDQIMDTQNRVLASQAEVGKQIASVTAILSGLERRVAG